MYGIDNPVADWHSFRQVDTASVAKIFSTSGTNLFIPRYHDISTIQSGQFNPQGYRFVEFPIYNAIISVFFSAWPQINLEVWGRLLSISFSTISIIIIYLLGKRFINPWGGIIASFFYACIPFNIYFTRVILPEPLVTMLSLLGLILFVYSEDWNNKLLRLFSAFVFSMAILVKPFAVFYLIPVIYLLIRNNGAVPLKNLVNLIIKYFWFGAIVVGPFLVWRWWESFYPEGIPYYKWIFNGDNIRFRPSFWRWIFGERLGYMILGTWGLIPFGVGLIKKTGNYFLHYLLFGMFLYVCTVATANVRHDYYQTLLIPSICLVLSIGSVELFKKNRISRILLIFSIGIMLMVGLTRIREFYKIDHPEIINAGVAVDNLLPKDAVVIAPYNGDTAFLYQTNRIGWPYVDRPINEMVANGAEYYVSVNFDVQTKEFMEKFPIVKKTNEYVILKLKPTI